MLSFVSQSRSEGLKKEFEHSSAKYNLAVIPMDSIMEYIDKWFPVVKKWMNLITYHYGFSVYGLWASLLGLLINWWKVWKRWIGNCRVAVVTQSQKEVIWDEFGWRYWEWGVYAVKKKPLKKNCTICNEKATVHIKIDFYLCDEHTSKQAYEKFIEKGWWDD